MKTSHRLSASMVAFLIGLSSPALAQISSNDTPRWTDTGWATTGDTLQSDAIDRMIDRDLNQERRIERELQSENLSSVQTARLETVETRIGNLEANALKGIDIQAAGNVPDRNAFEAEHGISPTSNDRIDLNVTSGQPEELNDTADTMSNAPNLIIAGAAGRERRNILGAPAPNPAGGTGGMNAWSGQTINTPPAITGGSAGNVGMTREELKTSGQQAIPVALNGAMPTTHAAMVPRKIVQSHLGHR